MIAGDYILCKKNYYDDNNRIFKKLIFKRNYRYQIEKVYNYKNLPNSQFYLGEFDYCVINGFYFSEYKLLEFFYSKQYERKIKLEKLKKISEKNI